MDAIRTPSAVSGARSTAPCGAPATLMETHMNVIRKLSAILVVFALALAASGCQTPNGGDQNSAGGASSSSGGGY
jgi:hypothetical protein